MRKQNKHTKLIKFNQNPFHNLPGRTINVIFNNNLIAISDFMGLLPPNKIKEKKVKRMRNPSTKASTSNDKEDPLHALHLQEVLLQSHHTGPSMAFDLFSLSLSRSLTLSFPIFLSWFLPQSLNFFLREIGFMIWG